MIEIDFKDLCIFEQLLLDELIRISHALEFASNSKKSHLYRKLLSDHSIYQSLYEEISDKLLSLNSNI